MHQCSCLRLICCLDCLLQEATKRAQEKTFERIRSLEEDLAKARSDIIAIRSERDKLAMEANFAREKLEGIMKESERKVIFHLCYKSMSSTSCVNCAFFKVFLIFDVFISEGRNEQCFGKKHRVLAADHRPPTEVT